MRQNFAAPNYDRNQGSADGATLIDSYAAGEPQLIGAVECFGDKSHSCGTRRGDRQENPIARPAFLDTTVRAGVAKEEFTDDRDGIGGTGVSGLECGSPSKFDRAALREHSEIVARAQFPPVWRKRRQSVVFGWNCERLSDGTNLAGSHYRSDAFGKGLRGHCDRSYFVAQLNVLDDYCRRNGMQTGFDQ